MKCVTLDALIKREDFDIKDSVEIGSATRNKTTLSVEDLRDNSFFFAALRKPDFQRETNEWTSEKVCSLIDSFLNSELVPAIILWKNSNGYIFAIDGAHRLSSLSAWINDDYGDGEISLKYFGNYIPEEQRKVAEETRKLVNDRIGSFKEIMNSVSTKNIIDAKTRKIANNLGALALQVQWVEGDSRTAEESFLKINQSATKISDAELELIKHRNLAHAITARAIIRAGRGHNYWSAFEQKFQDKIIDYAKQIHTLLFKNEGVNVDDISSYPIAGPLSAVHALDVVTQTVIICNGIDDISSTSNEGTAKNVISTLKNVLNVIKYVNSKEQCSLGLHPFVYFYSDIGKHKIGSFYGILQLLVKMINKPNELKRFIRTRKVFEEILIKYAFLVQQIVRKWRQSKRGYKEVTVFYETLIKLIDENNDLNCDEIVKKLKSIEEFRYLQIEIIDNESTSQKSSFSRGQKQQVKIQALVQGLPTCAICSGYISVYSSSVDHIMRKREGGTSALSNSQLTHLYCNTTYKN